ncbi:hypothetical protein C5167_018502 [Papaver somniferum]|uniref:Uncharacterized protein n=1 Tax=Papaver somniferum TaxID=3469 RepID=A0A4Y7IQU0_PAPSO|nr:hypothetical protein C5167_018502 [Papaver somniferum]
MHKCIQTPKSSRYYLFTHSLFHPQSSLLPPPDVCRSAQMAPISLSANEDMSGGSPIKGQWCIRSVS